jgi:hypothetical protein
LRSPCRTASGEKHAPATLADDRKQRCGGSPVFGVLFVAREAGHVLDGIAQRHERFTFTWYWYRLKFTRVST